MDNIMPDEFKDLRQSREDFYINTQVSVEAYLNILQMQGQELEENVEKHQTPTLMMLGGSDNLVN